MMRVILLAALLLATLVAVQAYGQIPTIDGEGCPDGHSPGEKFDMKPGCSQCYCHRNPADGHFCRKCPPRRELNIPGIRLEYSNEPPYPVCCHPKYVRV